jgi:hypothetical protein
MLTPMISPLAFLTFFSCLKHHQRPKESTEKLGITPQEVPEPGLGDDLVGSKDTHTVDFWVWLCLCGQVTPYDLVFFETHLWFNEELARASS